MKPKKSNPPPQTDPDPPKEKIQRSAPADADIYMNILDRYKDYRGCITQDGTCYNAANEVIGYIDFETQQAGSVDSEYLGICKPYTTSHNFVIEDDLEQVLGIMDRGQARIVDSEGSTVVEMNGAGEVSGHFGSYLGQFSPFTYREMQFVALWMLIIDCGMINEVEG